jgi:hypothetical protein
MKKSNPPLRIAAAASLSWLLLSAAADAQAEFAATVIDYHPGSGTSLVNPYAAVGKPGEIVGAGTGFDSLLSPFNPHYEEGEITQIGEGGDLTLRLGRGATVSPGTREIGIFTNTGLLDGDFPNGLNAGSFGIDAVEIAVSADGLSWRSLGSITCDFPSSAFTDAPGPFHDDAAGLTRSDYAKAHSLQLSDINGLSHPEILALLGGSAGGTWLDLSPSGLDQVGYIRFHVPDDGDAGTENTFELDALSINAAAAGEAVTGPLAWVEDFATDPLGTRATSPPGHATYRDGALAVDFDLAGESARTSWPLGQSLTDRDSFRFSADFRIEGIEFTISSFGQLSFGLINSATTGHTRTSSPSDCWDLLAIDYFPNEQFATLTPTVIGSRQAGQTNAFDNLRFPAGSASLINDFDEIGQLPTATALTASLEYDGDTRLLTLRLDGQAINSDASNTDGDTSTIQYTIPAGIEFSVDTFAILGWQDSGGGTAQLSFTDLRVSTPSPEMNYYSWADATIEQELDRAPSSDADGDGLSNLLSYALGGAAPTSAVAGRQLQLRWQEIPSRSDVQITPQMSGDLNTWSPAADSVISASPGIEIHQAQVPLAGGRQFLRLVARRP